VLQRGKPSRPIAAADGGQAGTRKGTAVAKDASDFGEPRIGLAAVHGDETSDATGRRPVVFLSPDGSRLTSEQSAGLERQ